MAPIVNVSRGKRRKAQQTADSQGQPRQRPTVSADETESDWVKDRRKFWAALKILNHLHYRFDVLALPQRAPPPPPALDPDYYTWD